MTRAFPSPLPVIQLLRKDRLQVLLNGLLSTTTLSVHSDTSPTQPAPAREAVYMGQEHRFQTGQLAWQPALPRPACSLELPNL